MYEKGFNEREQNVGLQNAFWNVDTNEMWVEEKHNNLLSKMPIIIEKDIFTFNFHTGSFGLKKKMDCETKNSTDQIKSISMNEQLRLVQCLFINLTTCSKK